MNESDYFEKEKYIWENYVPQSGQAQFVQGELLRAIEKLRDEAQRNGNGNFNESCHLILVSYLRSKLADQAIFSDEKIQEINKNLDLLSIENQPYLKDDVYNSIANAIVDWYLFYGDGVLHNPNPDLSC